MTEQKYTPLRPHGELREVLEGFWFVTGTTQTRFMELDYQFSRNMTVVRPPDSDELVLVNTVRLNDEGLAKLESLGTPKHVVKLGAMHGIDDAFYRDRYQAQQWALPGMKCFDGFEDFRPLSDNPWGASVADFPSAKLPEALLRWEVHGGTVVACDSLQNWVEVDEYFDEPTAERMAGFGFIQPANIGPGWIQAAAPAPEDLHRVADGAPFENLLPGHGIPLLGNAHAAYAARIGELFPPLDDRPATVGTSTLSNACVFSQPPSCFCRPCA